MYAELSADQSQFCRCNELFVRYCDAKELALQIVCPVIKERPQARESWMHIIVLPNERLQERRMIWHAIQNLRRREAESPKLRAEASIDCCGHVNLPLLVSARLMKSPSHHGVNRQG